MLSNHPQLFLDDERVASMTNVQRRINPPVKHPANPLIVQDQPWERRMITTYGTVLHDATTECFRCWYCANEYRKGIPDNPDHPKTATYYQCYAESDDGINWRKPLLGREAFGIHERHNVVIPGGHGFCVLPTPDDPAPDRRYRGVGGANFGFSPDGLQWDLRDWRDVVGKNDTSSCVIAWQGNYLAYVRYQVRDEVQWPGAVMRGVGLCVSRDFETWTPKELLFTTDAEDGYPWTQPYGLSVTPYGDQLIGILLLIHLDQAEGNNSLGDEDCQLLTSRDGRNWQRVADRAMFLAPTPETWDEGKIHAPATSMVVKDDVVYIYYSASNTRHGSGSWGTTGIGLATLPADRFVALQPADPHIPAIVETEPLTFAGANLVINAEAAPDDVQVEVLDKKGAVLSGFERSCTRLTRHDELRYRVEWEDEGTRRALRDLDTSAPMALRFILIDAAALYAFQITREYTRLYHGHSC